MREPSIHIHAMRAADAALAICLAQHAEVIARGDTIVGHELLQAASEGRWHALGDKFAPVDVDGQGPLGRDRQRNRFTELVDGLDRARELDAGLRQAGQGPGRGGAGHGCSQTASAPEP